MEYIALRAFLTYGPQRSLKALAIVLAWVQVSLEISVMLNSATLEKNVYILEIRLISALALHSFLKWQNSVVASVNRRIDLGLFHPPLRWALYTV